MKVTIKNGKVVDTFFQRNFIPEDLMVGSSEDLFDFLAEKCKQVASTHEGNLGFTFSFPVQKISINEGFLVKWTKGFDIPAVVGKDPVKLLTQAFDKIGVNLKIVALCNDTVGTLVTEYFQDNNTSIGVILGTGSNAAYWERVG